MENALEIPLLSETIEPHMVTESVDFLITKAAKQSPSQLYARLSENEETEEISWILKKYSGSDFIEETLFVIPRKYFRMYLARIGHFYLNKEFYAGYARRLLKIDEQLYTAAFFMSNEQLSGFWLDLHIAPCGPISMPGTL